MAIALLYMRYFDESTMSRNEADTEISGCSWSTRVLHERIRGSASDRRELDVAEQWRCLAAERTSWYFRDCPEAFEAVLITGGAHAVVSEVKGWAELRAWRIGVVSAF